MIIDWQSVRFDKEKGIPFNVKDPTERDVLLIWLYVEFGGVCNTDELNEMADILYAAYLRKHPKENKDER